MKTTRKIIALLAISLLLIGISSAQLASNTAPASPFATSIRSDTTLINQFTSNASSIQTSFIHDGLTFELTPVSLDSIVVGTGEFGKFFVDVSYITKESVDVNVFGFSDTQLGLIDGGSPLYIGYGPTSTTSYRFSDSTGYSSINFWHDDLSFSGINSTSTKWQDNPEYFLWYQAIDVANNRVENIVRIDDRGSELIDHNDGIFAVEWNLNPVSDATPVPEPSTYALFGAVGLLGLVGYKRFVT